MDVHLLRSSGLIFFGYYLSVEVKVMGIPMNQNERKQESRQEQIENMTTRRDMSRMTLILM